MSTTDNATTPQQELPDQRGRFGPFGGQFVPETLMPALKELNEAFDEVWDKDEFQFELTYYLSEYIGRPTPLFYADRLSRYLGGPKIYLKREDLAHTGAHKINNTIGQVLLAQKMGKKRIIAETGAGQHGVATATAAALFGLDCVIYMGEEDTVRQRLNVFRMKLMGAEVIPVASGSRTLKDAMNEAIRDWVTNVRDTHYIIGSVAGPHPYPKLVREFQETIGEETREQLKGKEDRLPTHLVACVGGGSNAMGLFHPFYYDQDVKMIGVEAAGEGLNSTRHSAPLSAGEVGILHGSKSYLLQNREGQISEAHSISAGLDYPGVGPEHSYYKYTGRAEYVSITDQEALEGFKLLSQKEGIIPALETSHAIAHVMKIAPSMNTNDLIVVCLSGRGDKDVESAERYLQGEVS